MRTRQELFKAFVEAFPSEDEVRFLAREAGLELQLFPINKPNMESLWDELMLTMDRQGKLRALVQQAIQAVESAQYKTSFERIGAEIGIQEELETFVITSGLLPNQRLALYYQSFIHSKNDPETPIDADKIIFTLLNYPNKQILLRFMLMLASHEKTNPLARDAILEWYEQSHTIDVLNLGGNDLGGNDRISRSDLDTLRGSIKDPAQQRRHYLMVVVEPKNPYLPNAYTDPLDTYMVSLYSSREGKDPISISPRRKVMARDLETDVITQLENAFRKYESVDSDEESGAIHTVEFYLPSSLLAKDIEPHLWEVSGQQLGWQSIVVISITERHVALNMTRMIRNPLINPNEQMKIEAQLGKNKRMDALSKWARFWERRWQNLNAEPEKMLENIVGQVEHHEITALPTLKERLISERKWAGVAFAFSLGKLQSTEFVALLDRVLNAGLPLILWTQAPEGSDAEAYKHTSDFLKHYIFEQYSDRKIKSAAEIVELIHNVRLGASHEFPAAAKHLTIVLDNPQRNIPQQDRGGAPQLRRTNM